MNVGLMFSFRDPPKWKKPWADVYESQLGEIRLAEEPLRRRRAANRMLYLTPRNGRRPPP